MAMLNCSYDRLILKVLNGVFVLAVFLPFCLSAVDNNCPPCGPGEYCSTFSGMCLECKVYCPGDKDCPSACPPIEPSFTTISPTTTEPASTQSDSTSVASDVAVQQSTNANHIPSGGDITFSDNGKDDSELPAWLSVGLLVTLGIIVLFSFSIFFCRKHCKTLKMPRICRFSSGDSENIELDERPRSDGRRTTETERTVQTNPTVIQPHGCHQKAVEYTAIPVDDEDSHVIINLPRPSQPNSSAVPPDPTHPTSVSGKTSCRPFQSASVRLTPNPLLESEKHQRACPSDRRSSPRRTPETHRKQTDGTHKGHEISIGASPFNPPNGTCEGNHSAHGD